MSDSRLFLSLPLLYAHLLCLLRLFSLRNRVFLCSQNTYVLVAVGISNFHRFLRWLFFFLSVTLFMTSL